MNRRIFILGSIAVILLVAVAWWWNRPTPPPPSAPPATNPSSTIQASKSSPTQTPTVPLTYEVPTKGEYQGMGDPRWEWWNQIKKRDPKFEWKMPVNFYGKVIDQASQPVQGAKVRFQWTDMSAAGTTEKFTETDAQGMFSLTGEKGKNLGVYVSRDGYHAVRDGRRNFEYAAFFEPNYIEPDPNNPVIFQLIKKQEAQPLIKTEQEIRLPQIGSATAVRLDDTISLEVSLLANQIKPDQPWSIRVAVTGGGLQTAADEFPVKAPTDGYQSSVAIDRKSPKPSGWSGLYQGGVLYVKTAQGYGRVEIRMLAGDNKARVTTYLNPAGSRNLESP
jgi:hypothetical protein